MSVGGSSAGFAAVDEFGAEDEGLDEFLDGLEVAKICEVGVGEVEVFFGLIGGGVALVDFLEELGDEGGEEFVVYGAGFDAFLFELRFPIGEAVVDDGLVAVAFFAMLADGVGDDFHLVFTAGFVDVGFLSLVVFMLDDLLAPFLHVAVEEGDAALDLSWVVAEVEPLAFAEADEFLVAHTGFLVPAHGVENDRRFFLAGVGGVEGGFFGVAFFCGFDDEGFEAGEVGLVAAAVDVGEDGFDEGVEVFFAGCEGGVVAVLGGHEFSEGGEVAIVPFGQIFRHVSGGVFGVGEHREQMAAVEGSGVVVADPGVGGEEEGVGEVNSAVVVADDGLALAVDGFVGLVVEELVELGVEDELADEPAPVGGGGGEVGIVAGEELVVIEVVAEVGHAEFVLEFRGVMLTEFGGGPCDKVGAFGLAGLVLFLGGHFLEVELLLDFIEEGEAGVEGEGGEVVEADVAFAGAVAMAIEAVVLEEVAGLRRDLESIGPTGPEKGQQKKGSHSHRKEGC